MTFSNYGKQLSITIFAVAILPSFFYQQTGTRICSSLTYISGGVLGLSIVFQEPLLLAINPVIAIIGISLMPSKKAKPYE